MTYFITFLEGLISFISPCMLPLLPLYISYFAGGEAEQTPQRGRTLLNACCFVAGFTAVFCALGLFAGVLGAWLAQYQRWVDLACGLLVILFGLNYLGLFSLPQLQGRLRQSKIRGAASAFLFGLVYSLSLTPCVGAFLGSALLLASSQGSAGRGVLLLLLYSLGLGVPFVISALMIERLGSAFNFIKRHYRTVNLVCGLFLIAVGIVIALGLTGALLNVF